MTGSTGNLTAPTEPEAPPRKPASVERIAHFDEDAARERASELKKLLAERTGECHVVAIQDFPDPDAISSAVAYVEIARAFDIDADIMYEGRISHPENLALVNLLEIRLISYRPDTPLDKYDAAVFVDNQGVTSRLVGRLEEAGIPTFAVIDHHDPQDLLDPVFTDIRPVGAAATQMAEYLKSGDLLTLDPGEPAHVRMATALMHGLHSETGDFVHAKAPEFMAAAYLSQFADVTLLEQVLCVKKSRGTMDTVERALAGRTIRGGFTVAGVGYVRWGDRDAIPQAADFLLTEENVHTAIVYGIVSDENGREFVSGSLRTSNATLGVDPFLKQALGKDARGRYFGGGRTRAGGFEIDVGFLANGKDDPAERDAKWALFDRRIRKMMFHAAGLDEDKGEETE